MNFVTNLTIQLERNILLWVAHSLQTYPHQTDKSCEMNERFGIQGDYEMHLYERES